MIKIVLLGAGHLAFHFYEQLRSLSGVNLIQWYSRSIEKIDFAKKQLMITDRLSELVPADLYLLCVRDTAIESVSETISPKGVVVHCAGGVPIDRIKGSSRKAVFYPLQTFTKEQHIRFDKVPFCIETTNPKDQKILNDLSQMLGGIPLHIDSEKRALIHLIAVFVNNFGNHILQLGSELSQKHQIPFDIFHPLIEETYQKAMTKGPKIAQTGPAMRKDQETIDKHLDLLEDENFKKLYLNLTSSIQKNT